jgi:phosphopantothenoylcysteine decarboxylase / phosphopantothenate---cysteine ligase
MSHRPSQRRILITAGPTHEPIDQVRYLANRSSGRLGVALATEADRRGWAVTLLLGPVDPCTNYTQIHVERFTTTCDLSELLAEHTPHCDVLIMAAAVADYRPVTPKTTAVEKLPRSNGPITLTLEPTEDLLADLSSCKRDGQIFVGFALEAADGLLERATAKLSRKNIDAIVANPLQTMDSDTIDATLLWRDGPNDTTAGAIPKTEFARWLMDRIESARGDQPAPPSVHPTDPTC